MKDMTTGKNNTKKNIIKKAVERHIGVKASDICAFFKQIVDGDYDYVIFISRRCYVLFQMFAIIENWSYNNIYADLGIFANRDKLKSSNRIIVVDDIGYTGVSLQKVLSRIRMYVSAQCKIVAVLYAVNKKNVKQVLNVRNAKGVNADVKIRSQLTTRQCHELSIHLVDAILASGTEYTTFVYPVWGKIKNEIGNDYDLVDFESGRGLFSKYKWETQYLLLNVQKYKWVDDISTFGCVRVYKDPDSGSIAYFLPFLFLKGIKAGMIHTWYECVLNTFEQLGSREIAEEIKAALYVEEKWKKDAIEYLASMMSCFCSKALAAILGLRDYLDNIEDGIKKSLKGSFSPVFCQVLEKCDADFASNFFEIFMNRLSEVNESFYESTSQKRKFVSILEEYVLNNCSEMGVYETTYSIFKWLKSDDSNAAFGEGEVKAIYLEDIAYVLENIVHFDRKDIYLAQIECWDIGVATYRFYYDEQEGIVAKCSAGEMSSVIPILKYQELIREFYEEKLKYELISDDNTQNNILENIIQRAREEKKYEEHDLSAFRELVEERKGALYGLLV